jgi:hypothetical protein
MRRTTPQAKTAGATMPPTMTANQKKTSLTSMEAKLRPVQAGSPPQRKRPAPDLLGGAWALQEYGAVSPADAQMGWVGKRDSLPSFRRACGPIAIACALSPSPIAVSRYGSTWLSTGTSEGHCRATPRAFVTCSLPTCARCSQSRNLRRSQRRRGQGAFGEQPVSRTGRTSTIGPNANRRQALRCLLL